MHLKSTHVNLLISTFKSQFDGLQAKAQSYHQLASHAREVHDLSIATRADGAARAYEEAMYQSAKWHTRELALVYGHLDVAEQILYEIEMDNQSSLPPELQEAIRQWIALIHLRTGRDIAD